MQAVYGDQCVDLSTIRCWVRQFKDGELGQAELSGRPVTASDQLHQDHVRRTDLWKSSLQTKINCRCIRNF